MMRLKDEHEGLRDTLFFSLFGDAVVFDDIESALLYLHDGSNPPARVYTKDGIRLDHKQGIFDPSDKGQQALEHLEFIFGELMRPPQNLAKSQQGKIYILFEACLSLKSCNILDRCANDYRHDHLVKETH